jgi:nitrogen fixation protein FixH
MNWGKGIVIGMSLFMAFILYMVINLMVTNVDLQSEDYYKKEIEYETEIAQLNNANQLAEKVTLVRKDDYLFIQLPDSLDIRKSTIEFVRPNDMQDDQSLVGGSEKELIYPLSKLQDGMYDVHVQFEDGNKIYLHKTRFYK